MVNTTIEQNQIQNTLDTINNTLDMIELSNSTNQTITALNPQVIYQSVLATMSNNPASMVKVNNGVQIKIAGTFSIVASGTFQNCLIGNTYGIIIAINGVNTVRDYADKTIATQAFVTCNVDTIIRCNVNDIITTNMYISNASQDLVGGGINASRLTIIKLD